MDCHLHSFHPDVKLSHKLIFILGQPNSNQIVTKNPTLVYKDGSLGYFCSHQLHASNFEDNPTAKRRTRENSINNKKVH